MLLYLAGNNKLVTDVRLNDADVRLLCETLKNNTFVTSLDLRYNNVTDDGAKHIAKLIEETPTLKEINLMCNDFGEDGAEAIAEALQVSINECYPFTYYTHLSGVITLSENESDTNNDK